MAAAALVWTLVGLGLTAAGTWLALGAEWKTAAAAIFSGLILGALKGRFLLARMARENAARIAAGPGTAFIGTIFPLSSWGLAACFMVAGVALRRSGLPPALLGMVYVAAGLGLLVASLSGWRIWRRSGSRITDP